MKKIILIFTILATISISCNDRLEDLNTPRKAATAVPGETLFTNGLREMFDMMVTINVNENVFKLYAQYWAQTTYPDESQYNMVTRNIPDNIFRNAYREALRDMDEAKKAIDLLEEAAIDPVVKANQMAIIDINMAHIYITLVDIFGHIPFNEALDADNLQPVYDDQQDVYNGALNILDQAINSLNVSKAGISADQDPVYGGDLSQWLKFANTLKLRVGMRLADVDGTKSVSLVNAALAGGVFEDLSDNFEIDYQPQSPSTNPQYEDLVLSGRSDFVPANTFVDKLNALNDPRRDVFFKDKIDGEYVGGIYGDANSYTEFSHLGDVMNEPDLPGTVINCSEVLFLLAEAAERGGYNTDMTAEEYYNAAIKESFLEWGLDEAAADAYIAQPEVAYATAENGGSWKQKIGVQMWISLFNQGFEGWTTWRRLDFTGFNAPPGMSLADVPLRLIYPIQEATRNGANSKGAGERMGGDLASSKIFWDVN